MVGLASLTAGILLAVFVAFAIAGSVIISRRRTAREHSNRDLYHLAPGVADGFINGIPLMEAAATMNPHVIDALNRWVVRSADPWSLVSYVQEHHSTIFSAGGHFIDGLKGYAAESIVGDHFASLGHNVVLATATNQPGWDLQIDGHPFQVKAGVTAARMGHDHLLVHPDIPVITDPTAAHQLAMMDPHAVIGLHDIGAAKLEATTTATLHGVELIGHVGSLHVPVVTVVWTSYQELRRLERGHTDFKTAVAHIAVNAAGVGFGIAGGAKGGALVGGRFGLHGAAIGGIVGGLVGGIAGKLAATFATEKYLKELVGRYRIEIDAASSAYHLEQGRVASELSRTIRAADSDLQRARKEYSKSLRAERAKAVKLLRRARKLLVQECRKTIRETPCSKLALQSAMNELGSNDRMAIAGILHQSQALSNKRLADLAAHYVASIMELENLLGRRMDEYSSIIIRFDFDTRTSAKQHLDNLAAVAKRLYAQCDALQSEIRTEMLKLGKPVSALPPAT